MLGAAAFSFVITCRLAIIRKGQMQYEFQAWEEGTCRYAVGARIF